MAEHGDLDGCGVGGEEPPRRHDATTEEERYHCMGTAMPLTGILQRVSRGVVAVRSRPRPHAVTPRRCCMASSGTPLVSGTRVFTQMSWSTIMPQKNRKTQPGWTAPTITGKNVVSRAANTQWVELPSVWPWARWRCGKISEMNTQMTAPWPTACAAMKAKMQAGTMA